MNNAVYSLGIDIGSTTVKIAVLDAVKLIYDCTVWVKTIQSVGVA